VGLLPVAKVAVEWLQSCYGLSHSQTTELHSDLVYRGLSLVVTVLSLSTTSLSLTLFLGLQELILSSTWLSLIGSSLIIGLTCLILWLPALRLAC